MGLLADNVDEGGSLWLTLIEGVVLVGAVVAIL
jgi:hypothetical protein